MAEPSTTQHPPPPARVSSGEAASPLPIERGRVRVWADDSKRYFALLYEKAGDDRIFFLAGAIAFNVIVAFVPLIFAVIGIAGTLLQAQGRDPAAVVELYLFSNLPTLGPERREQVTDWFRATIEESPRLLGVGTIIFMWLATRLIGTLRTTLREVFDIDRDRGIIAGKIFDLKMVLVAGVLFAANMLLTVGLEIVHTAGEDALDLIGLEGTLITQEWWTRLLAFGFLWTTFLLIYRYLPARRTSWRTSLTAATFAALFSELLKEAFSLYVTRMADYTSPYGNLLTVIIMVLWIYYTSVVFILAGQMAQVTAMQRIRRRQKERLQ
ncbi:MAG: YihY/virulence factor BrkB family protein [Longimicrobiales bacterium]